MPARGSPGGTSGSYPWPADPDDLVEPPAEPLAGVAEQGDVGDQGGAHPLVPEQVGQDRLVGPERGPAQIGVGEPVPAGPPAPAGRERGQVLGEVVVEDHPLRRQPVEVRRLDPAVAVRAEEPEVQAVADDDDDVHGPILASPGPAVTGVPVQSGLFHSQIGVDRISAIPGLAFFP